MLIAILSPYQHPISQHRVDKNKKNVFAHKMSNKEISLWSRKGYSYTSQISVEVSQQIEIVLLEKCRNSSSQKIKK